MAQNFFPSIKSETLTANDWPEQNVEINNFGEGPQKFYSHIFYVRIGFVSFCKDSRFGPIENIEINRKISKPA